MRKLFIFLIFFLVFGFFKLSAQAEPGSTSEDFLKYVQNKENQMKSENDDNRYIAMAKEIIDRYARLPRQDQEKNKKLYGALEYRIAEHKVKTGEASEAIAHLQKSIDVGTINYRFLVRDSAFFPIKGQPEFKLCLKNLQDKDPEIRELKSELFYSRSTPLDLIQKFPELKYQDASDPELQKVRATFRLDSIAGNGDENSKIIRLMHWIHNAVVVNNHSNTDKKFNSLQILQSGHGRKPEVDCWGVARALNECYLAMNIRSRYLICLPNDSINKDGTAHVINAVFSSQSKKWLWIDAGHNAYLMDDQNQLMSVYEVRQRALLDKPLKLNPEAVDDFNKKASVEYYVFSKMLRYMHAFRCPVFSRFNAEDYGQGSEMSTCELIPYSAKKITFSATANGDHNLAYYYYQTSSLDYFWQNPFSKSLTIIPQK